MYYVQEYREMLKGLSHEILNMFLFHELNQYCFNKRWCSNCFFAQFT
jgi:hypothetical protein